VTPDIAVNGVPTAGRSGTGNSGAGTSGAGLSLSDAGICIDERWLVRHVSLDLAPGRLTALAGPNGSGKSTLLRLLSGLWTPTEGKVELDGRPLRDFARRDLARRIAIVPQDTHISFAFTVRETVAMGRHAHVSRFAREGPYDRRAIDDAMTRSDISHLADRLVTELSGGERQRVLIARSLATEAETILLDEPIANLDIAHALDVLTLCRTLADEGRAIVVALHDLNAAATYATHAVLMKAGVIASTGAARELLGPAAIRDVFGVDVEEVTSSNGRTLFAFSPVRR
jgi:iron complex transport system ATP-binding protein